MISIKQNRYVYIVRNGLVSSPVMATTSAKLAERVADTDSGFSMCEVPLVDGGGWDEPEGPATREAAVRE